MLLLAPPPLQAPPAPALPLKAGDWAALAAFAEARAKEGAFAGVIRVVDGAQVRFERALGLARRGDGLPNTPATRFNLGSASKMWTAVAIGQLLEQGKLSLEDPLTKFLPEHGQRPGWSKVKLAHLLTHSSGFGSYWVPAFQERRERIRAVKDYFPFFQDTPLAFEPGAQFSYSNVGFLLLGAVVERVSGEDYFAYIQKHVLDPSDMKDSGFFELDQDAPNLALGYTHLWGEGNDPMPGPARNNSLLQVVKGCPAGGAYATASDMARFFEALRGGRLLQAGTLARFTSNHVEGLRTPDPAVKIGYGYGFMLEERSGLKLIGHTGGSVGTAVECWMEADSGRSAILLANVDPPEAGPMARRMKEALAR